MQKARERSQQEILKAQEEARAKVQEANAKADQVQQQYATEVASSKQTADDRIKQIQAEAANTIAEAKKKQAETVNATAGEVVASREKAAAEIAAAREKAANEIAAAREAQVRAGMDWAADERGSTRIVNLASGEPGLSGRSMGFRNRHWIFTPGRRCRDRVLFDCRRLHRPVLGGESWGGWMGSGSDGMGRR